MSLSTLTGTAEVRAKFKETLRKPKLPKGAELIAPPLSQRYGLVGTAFDYLFRFMIKRSLPSAVETTWIADQLFDRPVTDAEEKSLRVISDKASQIIRTAKERYLDYLATGRLQERLIASAIELAQLDQIFRIHVVDPELGFTHPEDIEDLKALVSIVDVSAFAGTDPILLNPTFGKASALVGGADADVFVDGTLYEIKVTKNLELPSDTFNQVMGYVLLNELEGIGRIHPKPKIETGAIYYARHAFLFKFNIAEVVDQHGLHELSQWLADYAAKTHHI